jgi:hypothetical protein
VSAHGKSKFSFGEVGTHVKGLFATRKMGLSTSLIWCSWVSKTWNLKPSVQGKRN